MRLSPPTLNIIRFPNLIHLRKGSARFNLFPLLILSRLQKDGEQFTAAFRLYISKTFSMLSMALQRLSEVYARWNTSVSCWSSLDFYSGLRCVTPQKSTTVSSCWVQPYS